MINYLIMMAEVETSNFSFEIILAVKEITVKLQNFKIIHEVAKEYDLVKICSSYLTP